MIQMSVLKKFDKCNCGQKSTNK